MKRTTLLRLAGGVLLLLAGTSVVAAAPTQPRVRFEAALQALEGGDVPAYRRLAEGLRDYALYPYLRFEYLNSRLDRVGEREVLDFIAAYADTPLADRLRYAWLERQAGAARWAPFLRAYREGLGTTMQCHAARALLATGEKAAAWRATAALWLAGKSQPKACDPLFAAWREAGRQTRDKVLARVELALAAGEMGLVNYLERFLPSADRRVIDLRQKLWYDPQRQIPGLRHHAAAAWAGASFVAAIVRLADDDAEAAERLWLAEAGHYRLDPGDRVRAERAIALHMAFQRRGPAVARLAAVQRAAPGDETVAQWRVRAALWQQDWEQVLAAVEAMPASLRGESEWVYWRARALEQLGRNEPARAVYAGIADCRCYYGFLAGERLGQAPQLRSEVLRVPADALARVGADAGVNRARELYALDRMADARREWYAAAGRMAADELRAAARLAHGWGWHDQAILTLGRVGPYDDLELRFPTPFAELVSPAADAHALDTALVYALMRQESAFYPQARSHAGAVGLMQMTPATARRTARKSGVRLGSAGRLLEPGTNVQLGTAHLRHLLDEYDDNLVFTLVAYNAGPHRLSEWIPKDFSLPGDVWVASLTFYETRGYVERILAYTQIYRWRLGNELQRLTPTLALVGPSQPPGAQARAPGGEPGV